jgi:hypothetical protein
MAASNFAHAVHCREFGLRLIVAAGAARKRAPLPTLRTSSN